MKILDRYLARIFFNALVIFALSFLGLYLVSDAMLNLGEFSTRGKFDFNKMLGHYMATGPQIIYRLAPFLVLMSAMFSVTRMGRLGELIPIRAAGINLRRTFFPLFIFAAVIGLTVAGVQEFYVPGLAEDMRGMQKDKYINPDFHEDSRGNGFMAVAYDIPKKTMRRVYFFHPDKNSPYHLTAQWAVWENENSSAGWRFFKGRKFAYVVAGFKPAGTRNNSSFDLRPAWKFTDLPKQGLFIKSDLAPVDVESSDKLAAYLSLSDLSRLARKHPSHHHYRVEWHVRLAYPVTFFVLLLIGLPCVLIPETRNTFLGIGLCLVVCLFYIVVFLVFTEMGNQGNISPWAAAWMPILIFGTLGITLMDAIKT